MKPRRLVLMSELQIQLHLLAHQHFDYSPSPETSTHRIRLFNRLALCLLGCRLLNSLSIQELLAPVFIGLERDLIH